MLFGQEHVEKYRETDGEVGHDWQGTVVLILTTTGRKSGDERSTPLIYQPAGDGSYAIVASKGGDDHPPAWFLNLEEHPEVDVQIKADRFRARARVAGDDEKPELWKKMVAAWPAYEEYQQKTDREIPVVVLERV